MYDPNHSGAPAPAEGRSQRQQAVRDWCAAAFGEAQTASVPQRGLRLVEEAIEAAQSAGCSEAQVAELVRHVFARPVGSLAQELGGSGVGLLALAAAAGLDADECEAAEVRRVFSKPLEHFAKRNQAKNDAGFLAAPAAPTLTAEQVEQVRAALEAAISWAERAPFSVSEHASRQMVLRQADAALALLPPPAPEPRSAPETGEWRSC